MIHRFVLLTSVVFILCVIASMAKALAIAETCPAQIQRISPIGVGSGDPAASYVYELDAVSPRSVDATIIADTSGGWYSWDVTGVQLVSVTRQTRHNNGYKVAVSNPLGVLFPNAIAVHHTWVVHAKSSGEQVMGWDAQGTYQCGLPAFTKESVTEAGIATLSAWSAPIPTPLPLPLTTVKAEPTAPPFPIEDCKTPFAEVSVTKPVAPDYPQDIRSITRVLVDATIDATGHLIDVTVPAPSAYKSADVAAAQAAVASTFQPGVSYCRPVGGHYILWMDFNPFD